MDEIRKNFHNDLESARAEVIRLGASLTESIPRATAVLLSGDLEVPTISFRQMMNSTVAVQNLKQRVLKSWPCKPQLLRIFGKLSR